MRLVGGVRPRVLLAVDPSHLHACSQGTYAIQMGIVANVQYR